MNYLIPSILNGFSYAAIYVSASGLIRFASECFGHPIGSMSGEATTVYSTGLIFAALAGYLWKTAREIEGRK